MYTSQHEGGGGNTRNFIVSCTEVHGILLQPYVYELKTNKTNLCFLLNNFDLFNLLPVA